MNLQTQPRVLIGVSGASGAIYANRLVAYLLRAGTEVSTVFTNSAFEVIREEMPNSLIAAIAQHRPYSDPATNHTLLIRAQQWSIPVENLQKLRTFANTDFRSPIASGSNGATHMVIVPCSMGTLSRVAHGLSSCLLERAADVMLKEKRQLLLVPRETPLSSIHLQNMLTLSQMGAQILPATPGFYHNPTSIEDLVTFVVERILNNLNIPGILQAQKVCWSEKTEPSRPSPYPNP